MRGGATSRRGARRPSHRVGTRRTVSFGSTGAEPASRLFGTIDGPRRSPKRPVRRRRFVRSVPTAPCENGGAEGGRRSPEEESRRRPLSENRFPERRSFRRIGKRERKGRQNPAGGGPGPAEKGIMPELDGNSGGWQKRRLLQRKAN